VAEQQCNESIKTTKPRRHGVEMYASAIMAFTYLYTHDLDLSPLTLKTFQQCPLTWRLQVSVASFVEIRPQSKTYYVTQNKGAGGGINNGRTNDGKTCLHCLLVVEA